MLICVGRASEAEGTPLVAALNRSVLGASENQQGGQHGWSPGTTWRARAGGDEAVERGRKHTGPRASKGLVRMLAFHFERDGRQAQV